MSVNSIDYSKLAETDINLTDIIAKATPDGIMSRTNAQKLQTFLNTIGVSGYKGMVTPNVNGIPQLNGSDITEDGVYIVSADGDYGSFTGLSITNNFILLDVKDISTTAVYTKTEIPLNITFDSVPTEGSTNAVESNGIAIAIEDVDNKIKKIAEETNLLKIVNLIDNERPYNSGLIGTGETLYFRSEPIPVTAGKRYADAVSLGGVTPIFAWYSSETSNPSTMVRVDSVGQESTAPVSGGAGNNPSNDVDATHLIFSTLLTVKDSVILQQSDSGFPTIGEDTFKYKDVYKKTETYNKTEIDAEFDVLDTKIDSEIDKLAIETDVLKKFGIVEGSRTQTDGTVISDVNRFRTNVIPTIAYERFAVISDNLGQNVTFSYYSSETTTSANFISQIAGQEAVTPLNATHVIMWADNIIKLSLIIQQLDAGFPELVQDTYKLKALQKTPEFYGEDTNILRKKGVEIVNNSRTFDSGLIYTDQSENFFRTEPYPIKVGARYAHKSASTNPADPARYIFYSSLPATPATKVGSVTVGNFALAPEGSRYMIFAGSLTYKDSYILQQLHTGFPKLGERTILLKDTYTKEELTENFARAKWYPDVFELDVTYTASSVRISVIDENEVLYGSDGSRNIVKATQSDLSDLVNVCDLGQYSSLWSLVKISDTKFAGYVVNPSNASLVGFYVFDNADTNTWTARKTGEMLSGFPDPKFQNFFRNTQNGYLFACSYSTTDGKDNNPEGTTLSPAPRHIYRSIDDGESWQVVYTHYVTENTHIHAIEFDYYRDRIWGLVGDGGLGGKPSIIYSDNNGTTWSVVANKDGSEAAFMGTSIIPTRKYVLFGSDQNPAALWKWQPKEDVKQPVVYGDDVDISFYLLPVEGDGGQNFGFSRRHGMDLSTYPYKIVVPFSYDAPYSKAGYFLSPNFRDWYMLNFENDPQNNPYPIAISGILSDGTVIGWGSQGKYFTFKYPNWIKN